MIEKIEYEGKLLALIIPSDFSSDGIEFFTPNDFSQQLAYMKRGKGYEITPHTHNPVERSVLLTQEVLFIRSGRVKVDIYTESRDLVTSRELKKGDIILLASGGHGFEMMEDSEIIEVKQGPYTGDQDKTRFEPSGKQR